MATLFQLFASVVVLAAAFYQLLLKDLLFTTLGVGRHIQQLHEFNVRCYNVTGLGLEGCEDMWLHEPSGLLHMSCGESDSRIHWLPSIDHLNATGRTGKDRMVLLDTRGQGPVSSRLKWMELTNFAGNNGDGTLDLHGFDIKMDEKNPKMLKMLLINHRPPLDPVTGELLDATKVGANSTVELFETTVGDTEMRHLKTYRHEAIETPNRVAWVRGEGFVLTNDKSSKVGFRRGLDPFLGGGSIAHCDSEGSCKKVFSKGLTYPNGLVLGADGLIYVPSAITGEIKIFSLQQDNTLEEKALSIKVPYPVDNLSVDSKGNIWAAGFPSAQTWMKATKNPHGIHPPTSAWRIRKLPGDYELVKVLEDDGSTLPGATIVVHDAKIGRLFFGGAMAPYIGICETR